MILVLKRDPVLNAPEQYNPLRRLQIPTVSRGFKCVFSKWKDVTGSSEKLFWKTKGILREKRKSHIAAVYPK